MTIINDAIEVLHKIKAKFYHNSPKKGDSAYCQYHEGGYMKKTLVTMFFILLVLGIGGCKTSSKAVITDYGPITDPDMVSMLKLILHTEVVEFDGFPVQWKEGNVKYYRSNMDDLSGIHEVVLIPSGSHTLVGHMRSMDGQRIGENTSVAYDFKPKRVYDVMVLGGGFRIRDVTLDYPGLEEGFERTAIVSHIAASAENESSPAGPSQTVQTQRTQTNLESALDRAAQALMEGLNKRDNIAVLDISSQDKDMAQFAVEELEVLLVKNKFLIVDRSTLDRIRQEQRFQLSGEVDENSAVSIGKFAGARVVIAVNISGSGSYRRLRLRALDTQNSRVIGAVSEAF